MLSGGEKMRVMLAVRLATAQAMAKKHERAIKTLIIDEALDGLDTAGKDAALTMISSLTNFERMLFITHDPSVAGYFPEKLHFVKLPDGSSAVV
jgi:DNA repair exonuclease SbcCD ATPase subunit